MTRRDDAQLGSSIIDVAAINKQLRSLSLSAVKDGKPRPGLSRPVRDPKGISRCCNVMGAALLHGSLAKDLAVAAKHSHATQHQHVSIHHQAKSIRRSAGRANKLAGAAKLSIALLAMSASSEDGSSADDGERGAGRAGGGGAAAMPPANPWNVHVRMDSSSSSEGDSPFLKDVKKLYRIASGGTGAPLTPLYLTEAAPTPRRASVATTRRQSSPIRGAGVGTGGLRATTGGVASAGDLTSWRPPTTLRSTYHWPDGGANHNRPFGNPDGDLWRIVPDEDPQGGQNVPQTVPRSHHSSTVPAGAPVHARVRRYNRRRQVAERYSGASDTTASTSSDDDGDSEGSAVPSSCYSLATDLSRSQTAGPGSLLSADGANMRQSAAAQQGMGRQRHHSLPMGLFSHHHDGHRRQHSTKSSTITDDRHSGSYHGRRRRGGHGSGGNGSGDAAEARFLRELRRAGVRGELPPLGAEDERDTQLVRSWLASAMAGGGEGGGGKVKQKRLSPARRGRKYGADAPSQSATSTTSSTSPTSQGLSAHGSATTWRSLSSFSSSSASSAAASSAMSRGSLRSGGSGSNSAGSSSAATTERTWSYDGDKSKRTTTTTTSSSRRSGAPGTDDGLGVDV